VRGTLTSSYFVEETGKSDPEVKFCEIRFGTVLRKGRWLGVPNEPELVTSEGKLPTSLN